jgi:signal peptidase I
MNKKHKATLKKIWNFFWHEDSVASWVANLVVAFLVIRFIVYPILGAVLGTSFPIVAVVSESMEHGLDNGILCGSKFDEHRDSFDNYWNICGSWYENNGISKEQFSGFPLKQGFYKGDVIILWRAHKDNLQVGDVLVFQGTKPQPIIHRVVKKWDEDGRAFFQTKGDHNAASIGGTYGEEKIGEERIYGKAIVRVPYLGWMKILFVEAVRPLGIVIER